ncbi:MAG: RidA family protein [Bacteroidia bacterium]|nr:RidA family protein [Bacteroidia bacterium]
MQAHYAPYISYQGVIYISGQLPILDTKPTIPVGIEAQTKLVLQRLNEVLLNAGSSKEKLLQVRIYVSDIELWDTVNVIYAKFMGNHRPARCIVPCGVLHYGCLIEVEAIAAQ